ncbi:hypothetical protein Moror_12061 [Moniliophthora roreri MCA 2997]|uniref:Uncharacterized protein n=2 Tax=Moniliophthora roreri TaxID=221103 RepID=V2WSS1_MONRO|nr:hypothetical protein Moror_12061 [Moniliophthora roreri MCA 2997]
MACSTLKFFRCYVQDLDRVIWLVEMCEALKDEGSHRMRWSRYFLDDSGYGRRDPTPHSLPVNLQLKAVAHGDTSLWMTSLPAAPVFKATYDPKIPVSRSVAALGNDNHLDLDYKPEPKSSKKGKIAAAVLILLLFIAVGVLAYTKWQRKKTVDKRKSFAQQVDKCMSTILVDWRSMSAARAQAAIRASMAGDPRASMVIRPMSSASSFGGAVNQARFGAGGGYSQPKMAQTQRTVGAGLRSSAFLNAQVAERVSRVSFAESAYPRPRPSGESSGRSVYERRSTAGQSRAFHQGFVPPLPNATGHGHSASITTSHLNISTTTLSHYPEEDPEDAMSPKQKQGAFSLSTDDIRLHVGGMEKDEDVGPALSMMRSQSNDSTATVNEEALYASMPTLPMPIHTRALTTESDDPMLFTASPMTPSFPSAKSFTPTSATMANLPYTPMSPDDMLRAYTEGQKQSQVPVLGMMERVTSPDDMLCAYAERQNAPGIERVRSSSVGRLLIGGAMSPSRGVYGVKGV